MSNAVEVMLATLRGVRGMAEVEIRLSGSETWRRALGLIDNAIRQGVEEVRRQVKEEADGAE